MPPSSSPPLPTVAADINLLLQQLAAKATQCLSSPGPSGGNLMTGGNSQAATPPSELTPP